MTYASPLNLIAHVLPATALFLGAAASCTTTIESSTAYTGDPSAQSIQLGGFAVEPGTYVYPQVLTSLGTSARASNATWQSIGAFLSSTTPTASGGRNYYSWSGTVTGINGNYWPSGGVARLRVLFRNGVAWTPGVTFDDLGCFFEDPSRTYEEQAMACAGHDSGTLHLVDGDPVRRSSRDYLSLRETPQVRGPNHDIVFDPGALYYAAVDPLEARVTLADWQAVNGFSPTGTALPGYQPTVTTSYFNHGDLALGRHMSCTKKTANGAIACYVTNYGDPAQPSPGPGNSASAALAATLSRNPQGLVATVAMEYRPTDTTNRVTFFAFDATGARINAVTLDTEGAKGLPGACISCHGGTFNSDSHTVAGAHFLPFDLDNFTYSSNALYTRSAQEDAFRALNKLVKEAGPTPAITELIDGWYSSNLGATGPDQASDFLPAGWSGQKVMYHEVVKPYCRGCHVALSDSGVVNFDSYQDLTSFSSSALDHVCHKRDMPHAEVTRELFWASPARGHLIGELSWPTACN